MNMRLDQCEGTPNPIKRNIGESQMRGHVDEVQSMGGELSVAFDEKDVGADLVEEGEGGFGFGEVVAVEALFLCKEGWLRETVS